MSIARHPDISTLLTCSAGSQPEALCAVVTSHLALCKECMMELERMEKIGVGLFECMKLDDTLSVSSIPIHPAQIVQASRGSIARVHSEDVPWPLTALIGSRLDDVTWTEVRPGVLEYSISLSEKAEGELRLLQISAGGRLARHRHRGEELTLVLRGSFQDEVGAFSVGDFADLDDETEHSVVAGANGCILLIANEHEPQFVLDPVTT